MGLADGRGRDRFPVELREHLVDARLELLLQDGRDGVPRDGLHIVLEVRQLAGDVVGDEVGPRRQHLAQLHEHPAGLFERVAQAPGRRRAPVGLVEGTRDRPIPIAGVRP